MEGIRDGARTTPGSGGGLSGLRLASDGAGWGILPIDSSF